MAVLGIDIGTGGSRAVIVDDAGRVLASSTQAHVPFDSPQTGWAEQDPADWWHAAQVTVGRLARDRHMRLGVVVGVVLTLAGFMNLARFHTPSGSRYSPP